MTKNIGFVGQRGMVGSVLLDRMKQMGDFKKYQTTFFSTSQSGAAAPKVVSASSPEVAKESKLADAYDFDALMAMDAIITSQGSDYTFKVHPQLRSRGWKGYWVDAASNLRMSESALIVLDPVNKKAVDLAINNGVKDFIGGNCTVSLMLMAIGGLIQNDWVEWVSSMTYQAASGAGARNMLELLKQMQSLGSLVQDVAGNGNIMSSEILKLDQSVKTMATADEFPKAQFGAPLAGSLIPWIDKMMDNGQTKEEWKGMVETNKILGLRDKSKILIDGTCVRIGAMRCHSQALTIKLKRNIPISDIETALSSYNQWSNFYTNDKAASITGLSPINISGSLDIAVGRVRKMTLGDEYLNVFTVGDQLLWGAAEPLRRILDILF